MSERKALVTNIIFYITFGAALILLVAGFFLPPIGQIDPTVIQGAGILAGFAVIAEIPSWITAAKSVKITRGDTSVEVTGQGKTESGSEAK